jgi:hypothetical protein
MAGDVDDDEYAVDGETYAVSEMLDQFRERDLIPEAVAEEVRADLADGNEGRALVRIIRKRRELRRRGELDERRE